VTDIRKYRLVNLTPNSLKGLETTVPTGKTGCSLTLPPRDPCGKRGGIRRAYAAKVSVKVWR